MGRAEAIWGGGELDTKHPFLAPTGMEAYDGIKKEKKPPVLHNVVQYNGTRGKDSGAQQKPASLQGTFTEGTHRVLPPSPGSAHASRVGGHSDRATAWGQGPALAL